MFTRMKIKLFLLILITLFTTTLSSQEKVVGVIENDADSKPISNVHVINLTQQHIYFHQKIIIEKIICCNFAT